MVRTEREKARERKKYDDSCCRPYTDDEIDAIEAQYDRERAAAPNPAGWRTSRWATTSARW